VSDQATSEPKQYFIHRTYPGGISSCGGPYPTRNEATRAARRFRPMNARSVEVREQRLDPSPRSGRHLVLRMRPKGGRPGHSVLVGPFVSRREARNFLRLASQPESRSGATAPSLLGSLAHDWEPVESNRTADLDANAWLPERRVSF
jgi:hypothetical protein